jgi:hypothetical protein
MDYFKPHCGAPQKSRTLIKKDPVKKLAPAADNDQPVEHTFFLELFEHSGKKFIFFFHGSPSRFVSNRL